MRNGDLSDKVEALKAFETKMAKLFLEGKVKLPVHFSGGNEEELVRIFEGIKKDDWVCTTYRNHYHALLRGMPEDYLIKEIVNGRSMNLNSAEYKFVTSAIVVLFIHLVHLMRIIYYNKTYIRYVFLSHPLVETITYFPFQ